MGCLDRNETAADFQLEQEIRYSEPPWWWGLWVPARWRTAYLKNRKNFYENRQATYTKTCNKLAEEIKIKKLGTQSDQFRQLQRLHKDVKRAETEVDLCQSQLDVMQLKQQRRYIRVDPQGLDSDYEAVLADRQQLVTASAMSHSLATDGFSAPMTEGTDLLQLYSAQTPDERTMPVSVTNETGTVLI